MVIKFGKSLFWGLLVGYLVAFILSRWIWLEMRINTSFIISIMTLLFGICGTVKRSNMRRVCFFGTEILVLFLFFIIYHDFSALMVIPAIKLKEAFFLGFLSLSQANVVFFLSLVIGNVLWSIPHK